MKRPVRKKYRSNIMASIHETAVGLYQNGGMDENTMREFDELCLIPASEKGAKSSSETTPIKRLRTPRKSNTVRFEH